MTVLKLPDLPQNWRDQPQLFERYWTDTMRTLVNTINDLEATQAQLVTTIAAVVAAQGTANSAQAAAAAAQATADAAAPKTREITTSGGLTGGGDLSADRDISIADIGTPGTYVFTVGLQSLSITVNAKGQVTAIAIT